MGKLAVERFIDQSERVDLSRFELLADIQAPAENLTAEIQKLRSPEVMDALRERFTSYARTFSRNYSLRVLPSPLCRWSLGLTDEALRAADDLQAGKRVTLRDIPAEVFTPRALLYNADDIALASEEKILAKLRHATQHIRLTDLRLIFEGQKVARDQNCLPSSFGLLQTGFEDVRVNDEYCRQSAAAKEKIKESLSGALGEVEAKINEQPFVRQVALNLFYGKWLNERHLPTLRSRAVMEASDALVPLLTKYMIGANNDDNFDSFVHEALPELQKIDKLGLREEMHRVLAEDIVDELKQDETEQKQFFHRCSRRIRRFFRLKERKVSPYEEAVNKALEDQSALPLREVIRQNLELQRLAFDERDTALRSEGKETGYLRNAFDFSKAAPELQEVLEGICSRLPQEFLTDLESRATTLINDCQSAALEHELPVGIEVKKSKDEDPYKQQVKFTASPREREVDDLWTSISENIAPSAPARVAAYVPSTEESEHAQALSQQLEERAVKRSGFDETEIDAYRSFKALELSAIDGLPDFLEQLRPYLPKKRGYRRGTDLFITGNHLDKRALAKRVPIKDFRIYNRREPADTPEPRMFVTLLIDNSGSMKGDKMQESLKTAMFWGRALEEMGVPFSIRFFGSRVKQVKNFDEQYDDPISRVKPRLLAAATADERNTNLGIPLEQAYDEMHSYKRKYPDSSGAIFVISDSGVNTGKTGFDLQKLVRKIQREFIVMDFLLTPQEDALKYAQFFFGQKNVAAPANFGNLRKESLRVLGAVLREAFRRNMGIRS